MCRWVKWLRSIFKNFVRSSTNGQTYWGSRASQIPCGAQGKPKHKPPPCSSAVTGCWWWMSTETRWQKLLMTLLIPKNPEEVEMSCTKPAWGEGDRTEESCKEQGSDRLAQNGVGKRMIGPEQRRQIENEVSLDSVGKRKLRNPVGWKS